MDELITLISETFETDAIGQRIPIETMREVLAHISSVSRSEWVQAGQNGLKPALVAVTPVSNYADEKTVVIRGKRYSVYRSYFTYDADTIELYLEEKVANVQNSGS